MPTSTLTTFSPGQVPVVDTVTTIWSAGETTSTVAVSGGLETGPPVTVTVPEATAGVVVSASAVYGDEPVPLAPGPRSPMGMIVPASSTDTLEMGVSPVLVTS